MRRWGCLRRRRKCSRRASPGPTVPWPRCCMALDQSAIANLRNARDHFRPPTALELADEDARTVSPLKSGTGLRPCPLVVGRGAASGVVCRGKRLFAPTKRQTRGLTEALARCRAMNLVEFEADILLNLARVRWDERSFAGAQDDKEKLREANGAPGQGCAEASPSAAATCCKGTACTCSWRRWGWERGRPREDVGAGAGDAAAGDVDGRRTTRTRSRTTRRAQLLAQLGEGGGD